MATTLPSPGISARDLRKLTELIESECGIAFAPAKKGMLEGRLRKRVRALGMASLQAYCEYLFNGGGGPDELVQLIDVVTTNKTEFFREAAHFEYLTRAVLPELIGRFGVGLRNPLRAWSSACSTGEEPYTLAMVLSEYARSLAPRGYRFRITGTDISTAVLAKAAAAVYTEEEVRSAPLDLRRRYLLRSKDRNSPLVRIAPDVRALVEFRRLNLMSSDYGFGQKQDLIFCRNVLIYFDRPTQHRILEKISALLAEWGYLIMGHSESLNGLDLPLIQTAPTVYRRCDAAA